jgi:hypothetical protein
MTTSSAGATLSYLFDHSMTYMFSFERPFENLLFDQLWYVFLPPFKVEQGPINLYSQFNVVRFAIRCE